MAYVVKVKHYGVVRRFTLPKEKKVFSYENLRSRIQALFEIPLADQFVLTYVDADEDIVTISDDEDLEDAFVQQALNPVHLIIHEIDRNTQKQQSGPHEIDRNTQKQQGGPDKMTFDQIVQLLTGHPADPCQEQQSVQGDQTPPQTSRPLSAEAEPFVVKSADAKLSAPVEDAKDASPELATENATPEGKEEQEIHHGIICDGCAMHPIIGPRFQTILLPGYDLCINCMERKSEYLYYGSWCDLPYETFHRVGQHSAEKSDRGHLHRRIDGFPLNRCPTEQKCRYFGPAAEAKTPPRQEDSKAVHRGFECDGRGTLPIEQPKFQSQTTHDFDLCHPSSEKSGSSPADNVLCRDRSLFGDCSFFRDRDLFGDRNVQLFPLVPRPGLERWGRYAQQVPPFSDFYQERSAEVAPAAAPPQAAVKADSVGGEQEEVTGELPVEAKDEEFQDEECQDEEFQDEEFHDEEFQDEEFQDEEFQGDEFQDDEFQDEEFQDEEFQDEEFQDEEFESVPILVQETSINEGDSNTISPLNPQTPVESEDFSKRDGLAAKMAAMGFENMQLNEELLEKNEFDLRKTLDDLCAAEEWDPILGELHEMGFYDSNMNRRLMFENDGSVKQVVRKLVRMYRGK